VGVADEHGEQGAVVADQRVAGDAGIVDGDRAAYPGMRGQRAVEDDGVVGVDPGCQRGHVLDGVGAQDEGTPSGAA
jgi:hypothetical protein